MKRYSCHMFLSFCFLFVPGCVYIYGIYIYACVYIYLCINIYIERERYIFIEKNFGSGGIR